MTEIDNLIDLNKLIDNQIGIMIYFFNDHCAPCQTLRPKVEQMMQEHFGKMDIVFVNSIFKDICAEFGVFEYPTILVFFDRKEYLRKSKYVSIHEMETSISRLYEMAY